MKPIKLRTKLLTYAFFEAIVLIIIGFVTYNGFIKVERMVTIDKKVSEVNELSLKLRKYEKDFFAKDTKDSLFFKNKESKYISNFDVDYSQAISLLKELEEDMVEYEEVGSNLYLLHHKMETYSQTFKAIVEELYLRGFKEWGDVGELRSIAQQVEAGMGEYKFKGNLKVGKLSLEIYKKDYFISYDTIYRDKFNMQVKKIQKLILSEDKLSNANKSYFREELEKYSTTFNYIVDKDIKVGLNQDKGMKKVMENNISEIEPLVNLINLETGAIRENSQSNVWKSLIAFILIGIASTIFFGFYLTGNIMRQFGGEPNLVADIAEKISAGNLKIDTSNNKNSTGVMHSMYKMVKNLRDIIETILASSAQIASASQQMSSASERLAQNSIEQAATTEEISSSLEEMLSIIDSNLEKTEITGETAKKSSKGMSESQKIFFDTINAVDEISKKTSIIAEISDKTDILSINAAIEAAGAGEHGKGFAVLAKEIRKLADKTKAASVEIGKLSNHGQEISRVAGNKLAEILPDIMESSSLMNDIIVADQEQKNGIDMINTSVLQLTQITSETSASSEEVAAYAEELASQSEQLKITIEKFEV